MTSRHPAPALATARSLMDRGAWGDVVALLAPIVEDGTAPGAELVVLYAEALIRTGRDRDALERLQSAEPVLAANGDRALYRRALNVLGVAAFAVGALEDANRAFAQVLEMASQADDLLLFARVSNNLGTIANMQGRHAAALSHYRLALPTYQRLGQRRGLAESYHNLAITLRDIGALDEADEHELRAMEHASNGVAPLITGTSRVGRAEIALRRGDAPLAEMTARLAADELRRLGDSWHEADACRLIGSALGCQSRFDEAHRAFAHALEIARERGHTLNEADILRDRSRMLVRKGDIDLAREDARAALAIFEKLGATGEVEALRARIKALG